MAEMLTNTLTRAEEALVALQNGMGEVLAKDGFPSNLDDAVKLLIKEEIKRALVPKYYMSLIHTLVWYMLCVPVPRIVPILKLGSLSVDGTGFCQQESVSL